MNGRAARRFVMCVVCERKYYVRRVWFGRRETRVVEQLQGDPMSACNGEAVEEQVRFGNNLHTGACDSAAW